ncbi:HNH endonuclease signature motif containing protein [Demequina sp. NBRC 110054]|uniref:HNH endonuclease signature motif containing protein n=1 Tax=Demequina sp. NBRC 110054 TaxID=1570343 RepID=UPI000A032F52|nr:HNH endonuclease signature motif containing protein [Demequina sp. NBRC 110054]
MTETSQMGEAIAQAQAAMAAVRALVGGVESWPQQELLGCQREVFALRREIDVVTSWMAAETTRRSEVEKGVGLARGQGHSSANSLITEASGGSMAEAGRQARAGKVMADAKRAQESDDALETVGDDEALDLGGLPEPTGPVFPVVAEAIMSTQLSLESADVIIRALERVADIVDAEDLAAWEARVVAKAMGLPLAQVRRLVASAEAAVSPDKLKEREAQAFERRYLTMSPQPDGSMKITALLDPVSAAPVRAMIDHIVRDAFQQRRDQRMSEGDGGEGGCGAGNPTPEAPAATAPQLRADALVHLARHAQGCEDSHAGVRTTVVVRLSLADLESGEGLAEVDGAHTPISVSAARQLAADAELIPVVLGGEGEVLDLGRSQRLFTRAQRLALAERDGGCARCFAPPSYCEAHHIRFWDKHGGPTDLSNGVLLCRGCHGDIHHRGWQVQVRDNRVYSIPPRHVDPARTPRLGGRARLDAAA